MHQQKAIPLGTERIRMLIRDCNCALQITSGFEVSVLKRAGLRFLCGPSFIPGRQCEKCVCVVCVDSGLGKHRELRERRWRARTQTQNKSLWITRLAWQTGRTHTCTWLKPEEKSTKPKRSGFCWKKWQFACNIYGFGKKKDNVLTTTIIFRVRDATVTNAACLLPRYLTPTWKRGSVG